MAVVAGLVGRVGVVSKDGRRIAPAGFRVGGLPLPLMLLTGPGAGHDGAVLAGRIVAAEVQGDEVRIVGATLPGVELPPGRYGCGMDLRDVVSVLVNAGTGEPLRDEEIVGVEWPELVAEVESGELMAVTIHGPGSTAAPVWDGVEVTVDAG